MNQSEIEKLIKSGSIAKQVVEYAKSFIKPSMKLLEIAERIEEKIYELGGKPAFPVNLSKNNIAAHSTPVTNDTEIAEGLLKVDIGIHIDGYIADTALSLDLEDNEENKKLIEAAETALQKALDVINQTSTLGEIGKIIESTIKSFNLSPIHNLSGHSIEKYNLHAGITIPNFDTKQNKKLLPGIYAIEPFSTNGLGSVKEGRLSGIYMLKKSGQVRDKNSREILSFIESEYKSLPFCTRWIEKKFGSRSILALKRIEEAGLLHNYPLLTEISNGKVAQAEHTVILTENEKIITTK